MIIVWNELQLGFKTKVLNHCYICPAWWIFDCYSNNAGTLRTALSTQNVFQQSSPMHSIIMQSVIKQLIVSATFVYIYRCLNFQPFHLRSRLGVHTGLALGPTPSQSYRWIYQGLFTNRNTMYMYTCSTQRCVCSLVPSSFPHSIVSPHLSLTMGTKLGIHVHCFCTTLG